MLNNSAWKQHSPYHDTYQYCQSQPTHTLLTILYMTASFDPELGSSSGYDTRI